MLLVVLQEEEEEDMAALKVHILVHPLVHHPPRTSIKKAVAVVAEDKKLYKCGHRKST